MPTMLFVYDPFRREKRFLLVAGWLLSLGLSLHLWRWVLMALVPVTAYLVFLWWEWQQLVQRHPDLAHYQIITVAAGQRAALPEAKTRPDPEGISRSQCHP
jgi:hypothetical protein